MSGEQKTEATKVAGMDDLKFFELTRAQIQHEDSLMNNRVTWLLALQAFLFAAYGFSLGAGGALQIAKVNSKLSRDQIISVDQQLSLITHARLGFAIMSFMSSVVLLCGIAAASASMENLVNKWKSRNAQKAGNYPQIIGEELPGLGIYGGLLPTYFLPIASSFTWLWLEQREPLAWLGFVIVLLCAAFGIICLVRKHSFCSTVLESAQRQIVLRLYVLLRKSKII